MDPSFGVNHVVVFALSSLAASSALEDCSPAIDLEDDCFGRSLDSLPPMLIPAATYPHLSLQPFNMTVPDPAADADGEAGGEA